ncbi:DNA ligase 1-like isoform X1 [Pistacia vera]|uniref:DNA ligase 1-like isoform X1 n=1 Tax=Pistacia vera TaxID=55513 RepID=UPI001262AD8D|nr:DNA ligase 1-like isoform X1 [Pistacia vera]
MVKAGAACEVLKKSPAMALGLVFEKIAALLPGHQFASADFVKMPFRDNSFDAVYAIQATCHAPDAYECCKEIAPAHEGLELGIGDASIIKALAEAYGRTDAQVKKQHKEMGDLGLVAKASHSSQLMIFKRPDALSICKVFDAFRLIAQGQHNYALFCIDEINQSLGMHHR